VTNLRASRVGGAVCVLLGVGSTSCAASSGAGSPEGARPTLVSWRHARQTLAALEQTAQRPRTMQISLSLREPITRRTLEARGALAVAPPESLRMILLGPGGTTSLDLWLHADRFRFAVPAIDLLRRGDASTPRAEMRGLPVDFLRWWLLRPTSGTLLWHASERDGDRFVLRDGHSIVDLRVTQSGRVKAKRTTWEVRSGKERRKVDEEVIEADRFGCGFVRYEQASTNLLVTVKCESEETKRAPNPRAFVDPDAPEAMLELGRRTGS
jgi:hypothetical protein